MKQRIKRKNEKYRRLELVNKRYKEMIEELQNKIKYDDYLKEENKKMLDWIQKILKEFGTCDVNQRERISIPVYKQSNYYYSDEKIRDMCSTTIVIPELVITKMEV